MKDYQSIDSFSLIRNGLSHIIFELKRSDPDLFRIAKESYHVLYRSMAEALLHSNPDNVTFKTSSIRDKHRTRYYKFGEGPWNQIRKLKIKDCKSVWRYSEPAECAKPEFTDSDIKEEPSKQKLIPFEEMLAMIQTDCCMKKYIHSQPVSISDGEMQTFDWLHNRVRNEFEHFIPTGYLVEKESLRNSSALALKILKELFHESGTVIPYKRFPGRRLLDCLIKNIQLRTT